MDCYNLKELKAPVIYGRLLVVITWLAEWIPGLAYMIGKDSGLFDLRKLKLNYNPTYQPFDIQTFLENKVKGTTKEEALLILKKSAPKRFSSLDLHQKYLKNVSPVQICLEIIKEIERDLDDPHGVHSIIKFDQNDILRQAKESESRYKKGTPLGPLDGIPITVKDEMDALPYTTSVGTKFLDIKPVEDALIVARLRKQGAIIIGKTNMHEFGLDVTNCNPNNGSPRNAYNTDHWTGGSSGGSAAAVASGISPISLGADGGGSIRIPAAFNGVYGLKPTHNRLSPVGGYPLGPSVGVVGPIASSAYDLAMAYYFTAGPDPMAPHSLQQPPVSIESFTKVDSLKDVRLGVFWPYFEDADPEIVDACKRHLDKLKALGAQIIEIEIPNLNEIRNAHTVTIASEFSCLLGNMNRSKMSYPTRTALKVFQNISSQDFVAAAKVKTMGMDMLRELYTRVDAIVTPTTGLTAQRIFEGALSHGLSDYTTSGKVMKFIFMANVLGVPAVTCPVGYDINGLPIGIQFQSKWWNEDLLLRLAHASEGQTTMKQPQVYLDLNKVY